MQMFARFMSDSMDRQWAGPLAVPITLRFDGAIPPSGLDADEVAAVADGMAKAVQFLAGRATDSHRDYSLHLTEVRTGSATFQFLLEGAALAQTVLPLIPSGGFSIRQIGAVFSQVVRLLEFLRGKPPAAVSVSGDNNVTIANAERATINIELNVWNVARNAYLQEQAAKAVKPLKRQKRMLAIEQDKQKLLTINSESYAAITARPITDNQPITVNTIEATLRVRQPHLDGENSWKFSWGRNRISAQLKDRAFMEKVQAGEEEFRAGDVLRVKLRIEEQQKGKNVTKQHYIDEVLDKKRGR
jgi:hypothetical protein